MSKHYVLLVRKKDSYCAELIMESDSYVLIKIFQIVSSFIFDHTEIRGW